MHSGRGHCTGTPGGYLDGVSSPAGELTCRAL